MTDPHEHCWHLETRVAYQIAPNQRREICCHCGTTQLVRPETPDIPDGHGPYYPQPQPQPWGYWSWSEDPKHGKED